MIIEKFSKNFFLLAPIIVLLGLGILTKTSRAVFADTSCTNTSFSGEYDASEKTAIYDGKKVNVPSIAERKVGTQVLGVANPDGKWIEVDLSDQTLRAWNGSQLFVETKVSTGLPWTPTPKGEFRIWVKLRATKMEGGQGKYYYYLPNVPYVMFFENANVPGWKGYGLHGTYWHNDFGTPRSHGCVNLPTSVAEQIYYWATPTLPTGKGSVFASPQNEGTRIVIHD